MTMGMTMKDYTVAHHICIERSNIPSIVATAIFPGVVARPVSRDPDLNENHKDNQDENDKSILPLILA